MEEAAKNSFSLDFIKEDSEGFERNVGNRGEKLSGGQKQRISIARCLIRSPKIFLFDEATSALDSKSETKVQKAIEDISKNSTSITIAHRLSTIKHSDQIFVFDEGYIKEKGTYEELLALKGFFAELAKN